MTMAARQAADHRTLGALLAGLAAVPPEWDRVVTALTLDSRQVEDGGLFLACAGGRVHGEAYIDQAMAAGAAAVALETDAAEVAWREHDGCRVPVIPVPGLRACAGEIAARFFDRPSEHLHTIGVTGTNGKTTVTQLVARALAAAGTPCGVMGSLGVGLVGTLVDTGHTTPDPVRLQAELAGFRDRGAAWAALEVSSHALDQARVAAVAFDTAVFTNIGRDHLDYHGDLDAYAAAKRRLLDWPGLGAAVLNLDDPVLRRWWREARGPELWGYSLRPPRPEHAGRPVLYAEDLRLDDRGLHFTVRTPWGGGRLDSPLLGRFNAGNLLAACAVLLRAGLSLETALERLAALDTAPGRMERFGGGDRPLVVVDYAHTPDALEAVLSALRGHGSGRLWCVFGCGGERDRGKRPLMGQVAENLADWVVVTDDNPRSEDPYGIIEAVLAGMDNPDAAYVERDRRAAIGRAVEQAVAGDVVLVAGKGHEPYQEIAGERLPFDDREEARRALEAWHG